jgi:hypothetical protein
MSRRTVICLLFALVGTGFAVAGADIVPVQDGRAAFDEGKKLVADGQDARPAFQRALQAFAESNDRLSGTALAQDLGNAAFLADDLPRAILAFRYGLSFDRHHALLRTNLAYARSQVRYAPNGQHGRPEPDPWPLWLARLGAGWYVGGATTCYCLAWVALSGFALRPKRELAALTAGCLALAAGAGYGCYLLRLQADRDRDFAPVIICRDDVPLRTGNGPSYPRHEELPTLARGMEARRLGARGSWLQIQFATGEIGWIQDRDALIWNDLRP